MKTLTEVLPASKSNPHAAIHFTPGDYEGTGTMKIVQKRAVCTYILTELPTDGSGRGFRFVKPVDEPGTDAEADSYTVWVGRAETDRSCECRGWLRWGHTSKCKHVLAAEALIQNGWL